MGILKEFKEFAVKGNVVDMAVGVIIGGAFGKIVSSLVADIVTPPIGLLLNGVDFKKLEWVMRAAEGDQPAVTLKYGLFLQATFDFLIMAIAIFALVKAINRMKRVAAEPKPEEPKPEEPSAQEKLLAEIRDLLKKQSEAGE